MAQRHFEDALALLQKTKDYINQFSANSGQTDHIMSEIQRKVTLKYSSDKDNSQEKLILLSLFFCLPLLLPQFQCIFHHFYLLHSPFLFYSVFSYHNIIFFLLIFPSHSKSVVAKLFLTSDKIRLQILQIFISTLKRSV